MAVIRNPPTETFPEDRQLGSVSTGLRKTSDDVRNLAYRNSFVSASLDFTAGTQRIVYHGLGQIPKRWTFEDVTVGPPSVWRVSWDSTKAVFESMSTCTIVLRLGVD